MSDLFTDLAGNDEAGVEAILKDGSSPDVRDRYGRTPLMYAS